jgi:virginiamycin B lyase
MHGQADEETDPPMGVRTAVPILRVWCVIALTAALSTACGGNQIPLSSPTIPGLSPAISSSASASAPSATLIPVQDIVAAGASKIDVAGEPDWLVLAGGSAWTATDGVTRLDGRTGKVQETVATKSPVCIGMDSGFGSLWAYTCRTPAILRIDPATSTIQATISLPVGTFVLEESTLSAGEGAVWAVSGDQATILRIDPGTNTVSNAFSVPAGATSIRAGLGALWVTNQSQGTLLRLDPKTIAVVATIPVGSGPRFLTLGEGGVWVLDQSAGTVSHVDPSTNTVIATVVVDSGIIDGGDIASGGGAVWARVTDSLVAKIDPRTDVVVARYGPGSGSGGVAADADAVWITAHDVNSVWRLPAH